MYITPHHLAAVVAPLGAYIQPVYLYRGSRRGFGGAMYSALQPIIFSPKLQGMGLCSVGLTSAPSSCVPAGNVKTLRETLKEIKNKYSF